MRTLDLVTGDLIQPTKQLFNNRLFLIVIYCWLQSVSNRLLKQ